MFNGDIPMDCGEQMFAKQPKTYLAITKLQVEVVVNFGMATLKDGFLKFVNNYSDSNLRASASLRDQRRKWRFTAVAT